MIEYTTDITDAIFDIKRLYNGLEFTDKCPSCGRDVKVSNDYISYGSREFYFYCSENDCETEWNKTAVKMEATLTVTFDE